MNPRKSSIEDLYSLFKQHPRVTTDTRNCPEGSIYIALKGERFNGNSFVSQALEKGCAYAITDEAEYAGAPRILLVDDCLQTLQQLARYHRTQLGLPIIGITGTNGKTTTKELLAAILSTQYKTGYTQGNLNNHIGVPLTLLELTEEHELAIIEMGANHIGEIKTLAEIALPDYGLITNVGRAHLEGFGSFEGVIQAKGELYEFIRKTEGKLFIDHENPYLNKMAGDIDKVYYGQTPGLFVWGKPTELSPCLSLDWHSGKDTYRIDTRLVGAYNANNILAAIAIGTFLGVTPENINKAIAGYTPGNNRSQLTTTADNRLIVDAYNANPTSMMAALENFSLLDAPRKALILGDMKELGANSKEEHLKIVDFIDKMSVDKVYLCGPCFREAAPGRPLCFETCDDLLSELARQPLKDYCILIKGSRSMKLEKTIEKL